MRIEVSIKELVSKVLGREVSKDAVWECICREGEVYCISGKAEYPDVVIKLRKVIE